MRIDRVHIQNFRGIEDAELRLDPKLTVLVGANNAGKTTVLDALAAVLGFRRGHRVFLDTDFRADREFSDVRSAAPIQITLRLVPTEGKEFETGELGAGFSPNIEGGTQHILLRLEASYSSQEDRIETTLVRLDPHDQPVGAADGLAGFPWRENLAFRAFGANRDLAKGMGGRWSDWNLILNEVRPTPETLEAAAGHFAAGSKVLINKTPSFEEIRKALRPSGEALGLPGSEVKLSASSQDPAELLQRVRVEMSLPGAKRGFSAERHGLGTQGALLFSIYRYQVSRQLDKAPAGASAILTVEEPEAHLHPSAQRKMAQQISELPGQVVVTSHSAEFVSRAAGKVALLRSVSGRSSIREVATTDRSFRDHPQVVFARSLLLAEGREALAVPIFAKALGLDVDSSGVEIINCRGQANLTKGWRCFGPRGLNLPVVILADGDRPDLEGAFLQAVGEESSEEKNREYLAKHHYFACEPGECVEYELAEVDEGFWVDKACQELDGSTLDQWLTEKSRQSISRNWRKKLENKLGIEISKIADLEGHETAARAYRMSRAKDLTIVEVARGMILGNGEASIPARLKTAIETAISLAEGR